MDFEVQEIRDPNDKDKVLNYRITKKQGDFRVATCFLPYNARVVCEALNLAEELKKNPLPDLAEMEKLLREIMAHQMDTVELARSTKPYLLAEAGLKLLGKSAGAGE